MISCIFSVQFYTFQGSLFFNSFTAMPLLKALFLCLLSNMCDWFYKNVGLECIGFCVLCSWFVKAVFHKCCYNDQVIYYFPLDICLCNHFSFAVWLSYLFTTLYSYSTSNHVYSFWWLGFFFVFFFFKLDSFRWIPRKIIVGQRVKCAIWCTLPNFFPRGISWFSFPSFWFWKLQFTLLPNMCLPCHV